MVEYDTSSWLSYNKGELYHAQYAHNDHENDNNIADIDSISSNIAQQKSGHHQAGYRSDPLSLKTTVTTRHVQHFRGGQTYDRVKSNTSMASRPQSRRVQLELPRTTDSILNPYNGSEPFKAEVAKFLTHHSHGTVLRHFMGFPIPNAPDLLNSAILVGIDTEWWEKEPKPLTELGIACLRPTTAIAYGTVGPHAENILKGISVMHARVKEHAHIRNKFEGAGDPNQFHFGQSIFIDASAVVTMLTDIFGQPGNTDAQRPPIILIGHAIDNDFDMLEKACGVNLLACNSIVKILDTQTMATEQNILPPIGTKIGLKSLLRHFNIAPNNLHTAGNDIAFTMCAAVLTVLKSKIYGGHPDFIVPSLSPPATVRERHIQDVLHDLMVYTTQLGPLGVWGQIVFCTRCDRANHFAEHCWAYVQCETCMLSTNPVVRAAARTHKTSKCVWTRH